MLSCGVSPAVVKLVRSITSSHPSTTIFIYIHIFLLDYVICNDEEDNFNIIIVYQSSNE